MKDKTKGGFMVQINIILILFTIVVATAHACTPPGQKYMKLEFHQADKVVLKVTRGVGDSEDEWKYLSSKPFAVVTNNLKPDKVNGLEA